MKIKPILRTGLSALWAGLTVVFHVSAHGAVLDQYNIYEYEPGASNQASGVLVGGPYFGGLGQTFVAGVTGMLETVEIQLVSQNGLPLAFSFSIYSVDDGFPVGDPLGTVFSMFDDSLSDDLQEPTTISLDFGHLAVSMMSGTTFALALEVAPGSSSAGIWSSGVDVPWTADTYASGYAFHRSAGEEWASDFNLPGADFGFATYVTPVPIPAASWLFLSALSVLFARRGWQ